MRRYTPAALLLLAGCQALDPAASYREAAKHLTFSLSKVEPRVDLAFPLERSRVRLKIFLKVENASDVRLSARALGGALAVTTKERTHALGHLAFPAGLDLAPRAQSEVIAELALDYGALQSAWEPLTEIVQHGRAATWTLDGEAKVDVYGIPLTLPLHATRKSGS